MISRGEMPMAEVAEVGPDAERTAAEECGANESIKSNRSAHTRLAANKPSSLPPPLPLPLTLPSPVNAMRCVIASRIALRDGDDGDVCDEKGDDERGMVDSGAACG